MVSGAAGAGGRTPDCVSLPPTSLRWAATSLSEPVVLRWTSTIRSAQRKSSRVRLDGATRSTCAAAHARGTAVVRGAKAARWCGVGTAGVVWHEQAGGGQPCVAKAMWLAGWLVAVGWDGVVL
eukprot:4467966-Prymnesium_polylepis.3